MKMLPFFANYGYNPVIGGLCSRESLAIEVTESAKRLRSLYAQLREDAEFINLTIGQYYDKRHKDIPPWKEGDKVYLRRKNIKIKQPSMKLDYMKLGPFKIKRKLSSVTFELELPKDTRIHSVFHAALLEIAQLHVPVQTTLQVKDEKEYKVTEILDSRKIEKGQEYLISWAGYSAEENSWEPKENVQKCQQAIKNYQQQYPKDPERTSQAPPSH